MLFVLALLAANNAVSAFNAPFVGKPAPHQQLRRAFVPQQTRRKNMAIWDIPHEMETLTDVQEAVDRLEAMDEYEKVCDDDLDPDEDCTVIRLKSDLTIDEGVTRKDLLADIQEVVDEAMESYLEQLEADDLPIPGPQAIHFMNQSDGDIMITYADGTRPTTKSLLLEEQKEPEYEEITAEEAAISASLYMNPAMVKVAPHVKITWEPEVAMVLDKLASVSNPNRPFMVGVVGIPGSGKSTSAEIIAAMLGEEKAIVMPMDGFHIPLAELAEFPNAADAIYRRGAPHTFHAKNLAEELNRIAYGDEPIVCIPGFDHAVGDPTPDQHTFERSKHEIVLCEGLYLLHDDDGWEDIKSFFDWTIYIDADVDVCVERLKERNKCIPVRVVVCAYFCFFLWHILTDFFSCNFFFQGYTPEEIEVRCEEVDRVNAETARDGAYKYASQIVRSGASN